jgi:hypothetical protein
MRYLLEYPWPLFVINWVLLASAYVAGVRSARMGHVTEDETRRYAASEDSPG